MSRTTETKTSTNPIKAYGKFSGHGHIALSAGGKDGRNNWELESLDFVLLDIRSGITGWNNETESGIYSNYVLNSKEEELVVNIGKGQKITGLYADIKDEIEKVGGKFANFVFVIAEINGDYQLLRLTFTGTGLQTFSEFRNSVGRGELYDSVIRLSKNPDKKSNGAVKYFVPKFELLDLSDEVSKLADKFDNELQAYFSGGESDKESGQQEQTQQEKDDEKIPY